MLNRRPSAPFMSAPVRRGDNIGDWLNVPIYQRSRLELRRIDVLLFILGSGIATNYWLFYGWRWAVMGALMYILVVMAAVWIL
jgi:hypothetical protein